MSLPSRKTWSRALVLAWALPLFVLGPVLNGRTLLWHAHDDAGAHLHVLAEHGHDRPDTHEEHGHAAHLAEEHGEHSAAHHEGAPPPAQEHRESDCFVVSLSGPFSAPARGAPVQRILGVAPVPRLPLDPRIHARRLDAGPAPWRLSTKLRSGAALLVATGRALLI